ncbi:MAG: LysR family transcriptional regulator, partial [Terrabacter sp.]|nr:LysR family transcriptional regulator [Terrabacter sp.]
MDLDLRLVRYFVAVAEELHFGRAAARLYVSQPALSKQVRKLEQQLGEPLLVRSSRHVALTARGRSFFDDAQRLLAIADGMTHTRPEGLSIAHIFELSTSRLVADAFSRAEPDVPLREHAMDSITQLAALV